MATSNYTPISTTLTDVIRGRVTPASSRCTHAPRVPPQWRQAASVKASVASVAWVKRCGTQVLLEGIARTLGLYGSQRRYV